MIVVVIVVVAAVVVVCMLSSLPWEGSLVGVLNTAANGTLGNTTS